MWHPGWSKSTIIRLLAVTCKLLPTAIPQYKKHLGWKRETSQLTDWLPRLTAKDLKKLYSQLLKDVVICTIQHCLIHYLWLSSRVAALSPLLTNVMWYKQLNFTKDHKNWTVNVWKNVLFSDKSSFCVVMLHRLHVRRPLRQNCYDPQYTIKTVKHCFGDDFEVL